ncbi:WD40-repeat-containing domain protein [Syncephalastrum racemosum]|uniref:WD40-repeat-containing domain protein n=1 Tax=Syncephalastrum racemosum TaxID=13706 RepID=A0A1X2HPV8_SYNRA|nr:WD40-repeat-containing domain protein [Syncephalastrum racemosum]
MATITFRHGILAQLDARDKREKAYTDTICANQRLVEKIIDLQSKNKDLEAARRTFELHASENKENQGSPAGGSGNQKRIAELNQRIQELHEERADMYKIQSENAQRLVHMNDQLRIKEESEKANSLEMQELKTHVKQLASKCDLQMQQLKEKDVTIQILQDEVAAIQLEITTMEERNKKLEKENAQLLQRWLDKMNQEAEKMNEATQFYESFLEQARSVGQTIRKSGGKWILRPASTAATDDKPKGIEEPSRHAMVTLPNAPARELHMHDSEVFCIQASSTGSLFATGSADRKIKLYDAKTGNVVQTLSGALQTITSVRFNPTDELILGTSTDNATRVWSLGTNRVKHTLTGHIGKVYAAQFTADSRRVVSGSHDRTLKVWDLQRGYCTRTIFTFSSCNDLALVDADGQTLASGHLDNHVRIWDTRTGNAIKELTAVHSGQVTSVSVSPDGSKLLTNSRDNTLKLVDLRMYDIVATYQAESYRNGANWSRACFSPDGNYIAAGSSDGTLHVWDAESRKLERALKAHSGIICGVSWNPMGSHLYSADMNKGICMWNTTLET